MPSSSSHMKACSGSAVKVALPGDAQTCRDMLTTCWLEASFVLYHVKAAVISSSLQPAAQPLKARFPSSQAPELVHWAACLTWTHPTCFAGKSGNKQSRAHRKSGCNHCDCVYVRLTWQVGEGHKKKKVEQQYPANRDGKGYPYPQPVMPEVVEVQHSFAQLLTRITWVGLLPPSCNTKIAGDRERDHGLRFTGLV